MVGTECSSNGDYVLSKSYGLKTLQLMLSTVMVSSHVLVPAIVSLCFKVKLPVKFKVELVRN